MAEIFENKREALRPEILAAAGQIEPLIEGIDRCTQRLREMIELRTPMCIVTNEVRMIQYRALAVLSHYESLALMDWVTGDDLPDAGDGGDDGHED
jgi:hypothetical protein